MAGFIRFLVTLPGGGEWNPAVNLLIILEQGIITVFVNDDNVEKEKFLHEVSIFYRTIPISRFDSFNRR